MANQLPVTGSVVHRAGHNRLNGPSGLLALPSGCLGGIENGTTQARSCLSQAVRTALTGHDPRPLAGLRCAFTHPSQVDTLRNFSITRRLTWVNEKFRDSI